MSDIRGVGVDLCAISRMYPLIQKQSFMNRCFSEEEQAYILSKGKRSADTMAGLWAAKQAVLKALGCGIAVPLTEISVSHTEQGAPVVSLSGKALELADGGSFHLSITHEGDMACAFCIWS